MATPARLDELTNVLKGIGEYNATELTERAELGSLNFRDLKEEVEQIIQLAKELKDSPLRLLSDGKLDELKSGCVAVIEALGNLLEFRLDRQFSYPPQQERDQRAQAMKSGINQMQNIAVPIIPFLKMNDPSFLMAIRQSDELLANLKSEADATSKTLQDEISKKTTEIDSKLSDIDSALQVARETASQAGVGRHAVVFDDACQENNRLSKVWLVTTGVMVLTTVLVAFLTLYEFPSTGDLKDPATLQRIILRLVTLSILYYGAIWSSKNYHAHRSLAVFIPSRGLSDVGLRLRADEGASLH
jgi:hypothetical protein